VGIHPYTAQQSSKTESEAADHYHALKIDCVEWEECELPCGHPTIRVKGALLVPGTHWSEPARSVLCNEVCASRAARRVEEWRNILRLHRLKLELEVATTGSRVHRSDSLHSESSKSNRTNLTRSMSSRSSGSSIETASPVTPHEESTNRGILVGIQWRRASHECLIGTHARARIGSDINKPLPPLPAD